MNFENRETAAYQLLNKLMPYKGKNPLVAGIPRGAMPMAKIIADGLQGELSAVLVHKIPAPGNQEFAIGCVGLSGKIHSLSHAKTYGTETYIEAAAQKQLKVLRERQKLYGLHELNYKDRVVIIVDDGIATGATTICAVQEVRSQSPEKIILATPVSSADAAEQIRPLVEELVVLYLPPMMFSIGEFYESFPQVSDHEVIAMLKRV